MIAGPRHYAALARTLRWDAGELKLEPDARAWAELPRPRRDRLAALLCGFCVAETSVAQALTPFAAAASDRYAAAVFEAQRVDEERHATLFDRIAREVVRLPGRTGPDRRAAARAQAEPALVDLFEVRLPMLAANLASRKAALAEAVGLYHMILEGIVLSAGQHALLVDLADDALPGIRTGLRLVERDERWHVGFGLRCLLDLAAGPELIAALVRESQAAAQAWGDAVPIEVRERVVAMHHRRMAAVGLPARPAPAQPAIGSAAWFASRSGSTR
jgi:ribonucleoside-diphosphate reductase beta chain